ncbi:MAG: hypothetical protein EOP49_26830 [Sphingobacteriales bacterium]|nr:MAG: hypothetical protein EOP49_26830 [Sphingobacteriales bacterium]
MFFANLQMAYMGGSYYELQDRDRLAVNTNTGSFNFSLLRTGISAGPVSVNIIPLQNIQSVGSSFAHAGAATYGDTMHGSISYTLPMGILAGDKLRFVYEINTGGILLHDTIEKIYQPLTVMFDNLDGSLANWTFSNGWGASTVNSFSGTRSISESPSGDYASSRTSSAVYNVPLDLSGATAAYLSFWVRHRAENGDDKLQIQLSPSGPGAGSSFASVCGRNTIAENNLAPSLTGIRENWTRETVDLENYLGASNIGLRFLFTSNGSNTDDGFYIDDIEIVKSNAIVLAPVKVVNAAEEGKSIGAARQIIAEIAGKKLPAISVLCILSQHHCLALAIMPNAHYKPPTYKCCHSLF